MTDRIKALIVIYSISYFLDAIIFYGLYLLLA
jgi:hypothetical protein